MIPALLKCSRKIDEVVSKTPLYSWAHFRGADLLVGLYWLHERTGDRSVLDLAAKSVLVQMKAPTHVHDATFDDTPDTLYTAAHGKVAVYELKG